MVVKINWRVRLKNKNFWIAIIPAALILIQTIASLFGVELELGDIGNKLLAVINSVFGILAILGIVTDPTTSGITDSDLAMSYDKPKKS